MNARQMIARFADGGDVSTGLKYATDKGGIGADQYYANIRNFIDKQGADLNAAEIRAEMDKYGVSDKDVRDALAKTQYSAGAIHALLNPDIGAKGSPGYGVGGLEGMSANIRARLEEAAAQAQTGALTKTQAEDFFKTHLSPTGGFNEQDLMRATGKSSAQLLAEMKFKPAGAPVDPRLLPPTEPLPDLTEEFVAPTAPLPQAPPVALTAGQEGLDPGTAIVGKIPESERVTIPQLDTEFRASAPRTATYDRFGRITGYNYSPATKLTPATGTNVFNFVPPGITSRPRSLLNLGDVPGVTIDPVTGQPTLGLSASQRFARDRAELDNQFRQLYARAAEADTSLPTQAPSTAAAAFRNFAMNDPTMSAQLRMRNIEQTPTVNPTAAMTAARSEFGAAPYAAALTQAFDPFLARNRASLLASKDMQRSYFERYPDLVAEYEKNWSKTMSPEEYAAYHYRTLGQKEGRTPPNLMGSPYTQQFFSKGGDVSRGTSEVPQLDAEGQLIDENAEMRSESQRMLNRLKTAQQESYRRGKLPPGIQRAVTDVASEENPPLVRGKAIQTAGDIVGGLVSATPREPTNPSEAYRLMQGFTGAYLPTAPVVRTAQAAKMAAQEPRATMSAARQSLEALGDIPVALAQPNQLGAQAGAIRLGGKESGNKPSSIFTPLPKADAPFVGRLDSFVSELPGAVRKDQFLGSLEGKFRSYEIGRAQEALRDLPGDAKLSPVDLLNRIKQRYDPAYYRTQVVEPQPSSFYYQMDNVYQGPAGDEFPLGVIHLIQADNPQNVSKGFGKKLEKMIDRTFGGSLSPEQLTETRSDLLNIFGTLSSADKRRLAGSWTPYARANQEAEGFEQTVHNLLYPSLNRDFTETLYKSSLSSPETRDAALTQILQDTAEVAKNKYGIEGLEPHLPGLIQEHLGNQSGTEAYNAVRGLVSNRRRELSKKVYDSAKGFRSTLRDLEDKQVENYRGQHTTLGNENNPIAFSRFSEHTTDIPGLGTTKGIYVNELQSDRLDDIRTKGPYGGSAQKDLATRVIPLKEQQAQLLEQFIKLKSKGASYDQLSAASKQLNALDEKIAKATKRVMEGTYSIRESFPGMEESPQVIQQLMAKNVISAAINRGVNFVAFPGAESKQAQLYEKLPNNLKQVVKDLGPGFEFRPVTLRTPDGQELTHPAVVWGPEAANRIKQKGVPFKDGGEVNVPRETSTSKQQLDKLAQVSQRKKA